MRQEVIRGMDSAQTRIADPALATCRAKHRCAPRSHGNGTEHVVETSRSQDDLEPLVLSSLIPRERYNASIAVREIQNLLKDRTYAERAAAIAAQVRNEDRTARACDLLGRLLEDPNAEVTNPQLTAQAV